MASFKLEVLDAEKFIQANNCREVTNPIMFVKGAKPTEDGLLSNEIFGITQEERSQIYAYIDLHERFIQPYYYKIWLKIDRNLNGCVYETSNYRIDDNGYLVPDENGETGIEFLARNVDRLNFKNTKKDMFLNTLLKARDDGKLFTTKLIVIPPYYRDVNTTGSGKMGVGEINKLYISLLNSVRALRETSMYGFNFSGGTRGIIQNTLVQIYNWFTVGQISSESEHTGAGIFKKFGLMRRSAMSKTTDNAARLVISAPNINVNSKEDLMVDMDYSAIPLSAALVIAYPFVIYYLNNWFRNEFGGKTMYPAIKEDGTLTNIELDNPLLEFSNDRFDAEINEFVHGYSNRYKPIYIPNKQSLKVAMPFKGYSITPEEYASGIREKGNMIVERDMCWVDILYMAAVAATKDKVAVITRYPVN